MTRGVPIERKKLVIDGIPCMQVVREFVTGEKQIFYETVRGRRELFGSAYTTKHLICHFKNDTLMEGRTDEVRQVRIYDKKGNVVFGTDSFNFPATHYEFERPLNSFNSPMYLVLYGVLGNREYFYARDGTRLEDDVEAFIVGNNLPRINKFGVLDELHAIYMACKSQLGPQKAREQLLIARSMRGTLDTIFAAPDETRQERRLKEMMTSLSRYILDGKHMLIDYMRYAA